MQHKIDLRIVGYDVQEQLHGGGPPVWAGLRVRLVAPSELINANFVHSDEFIRIMLNLARGKGGVCFGDSGGHPSYRSVQTASWLVPCMVIKTVRA